MAGKKTRDDVMSASRLPGLLGHSQYSTPNDELQYSIDAIHQRPRPDIGNEAMGWGNRLEPLILGESCRRMGITQFEVSIDEALEHATIPLACSLDGIGHATGQVMRSDPEQGIYVVGAEEIVLDGPGVLEAKLTRTAPEEVPHLARGPIQLQGQMLVTGYRWGAVCVLYGGTELRTFLFAPHPATQEAIAAACHDFERRLDLYRNTMTVEWYPPASSAEVNRMHPMALDQVAIDLPAEAEALCHAIVASRKLMRDCETAIDATEKDLKVLMREAGIARVGRFEVRWPMRSYKATPQKIVPAKEAYTIRQNTLTVKER
jgi:predicted phage-related endonuclease